MIMREGKKEMARPRKEPKQTVLETIISEDEPTVPPVVTTEQPVDDPRLPNKSLFRIDEVATYFGVATSTIYLWIEHGILTAEKYRGTIRVPRESIVHCRLANRLHPVS